MTSTGTAAARAAAAPARVDDSKPKNAPEVTVPARAREAAEWFFWVVAVTAMDSLLVILGSRIPRFTGFGLTALVDQFTGSSPALHVMANGWLGAFLLFLGFCAWEGRKKVFAFGLAVYGCDTALLLAAHDYFGIPFHAFVLYQLYRGLAAEQGSLSSRRTATPSSTAQGS